MKTIIIYLLLTVSLLAQASGSVGTSDARSVGMAKSYTAASRGVFSIGYNPANLMFSDDNHFEMTTVLPFPNLKIRTGTDFITIEDYNYFFGGVERSDGTVDGRALTDSDKDRLKSLFEDGGFVVADFSTSVLTASYKASNSIGAFAFGIHDVAAFKVNFPEEFIHLALDGNTAGKIYNFNDAEMKGWWLRNYSLSYARDLNEIPQKIFKKLSAGITLKYVQGFSYAGIDHVKSTFETGTGNEIITRGDFLAYAAFSPDLNVKYDFDSTDTDEEGSFSPFPSPAGTGFGFDLGFAAQLDDKWSFGLSLTDIGSITWDKNVARYSSDQAFYLTDITDDDVLDSVKNSFVGEGEYISEISTALPAALRFGAALQIDKYFDGGFPGQMLLAFDFNQGFNNQPRNSKKPRFSLGMEWKPMDWIPYIRTGISVGGKDAFGWAFGIGIDAGVLEFNFASPDFHYFLMANNAKRVALSLDTRWKF